MTTRDRALWIVFALCAVGAVFFWTQPARRAAALRRASLPELEAQAKRAPNADALLLLGEKLRAAERLPEAYDAYARAAELAPRNFDAWNATAELAEQLHGRQGAFDVLATYARNNPGDARGHLGLARLYYLNQAHERALRSARTAVSLDPKLAEAWRIIGWESLTNDARADAQAAMRKAVEVAPDDFRSHVALGDVLMASGQPENAVDPYRQALRLSPADANAQAMLARALLKSRSDDSAVVAEAETLTRKSLAQSDGRAVTHAILAEIFERRGDLPAAVQEYETAALLNPRYTDAPFRLAAVYRQRKDAANFRRWSERHRRLTGFLAQESVLRQRIQQTKDPEQARRLAIALARQTAQAGIVADAAEQMQALLQQKPDPALNGERTRLTRLPEYRAQQAIALPTATLMKQGDLLLAQGRPAQAVEPYFLAVRRNRFNPKALQNLGLSYVAQGLPTQGAPFLAEAVRLDPNLSRAHFALGDIAAQSGALAQAQSHYEKGLEAEPDMAEAHFRLGEIRRDNQQQSQAYAAFEKAHVLQPAEARYAREWADSLSEQGKTDEAEAVLRKSLAARPGDGETEARLGTLLLQKSDKIQEAEALLKRALQSDPSDDYARYGLAQAALKQGRASEARQLLDGLTRRNPAAREMWVTLGQAARQMGDKAGATRALDRARVLEQTFLMGRTLSEQVEKRPGDDALRVRLARAQATVGDLASALRNYDYALRRQPTRADWKRERDRLRQTATGATRAVAPPPR